MTACGSPPGFGCGTANRWSGNNGTHCYREHPQYPTIAQTTSVHVSTTGTPLHAVPTQCPSSAQIFCITVSNYQDPSSSLTLVWASPSVMAFGLVRVPPEKMMAMTNCVLVQFLRSQEVMRFMGSQYGFQCQMCTQCMAVAKTLNLSCLQQLCAFGL